MKRQFSFFLTMCVLCLAMILIFPGKAESVKEDVVVPSGGSLELDFSTDGKGTLFVSAGGSRIWRLPICDHGTLQADPITDSVIGKQGRNTQLDGVLLIGDSALGKPVEETRVDFDRAPYRSVGIVEKHGGKLFELHEQLVPAETDLLPPYSLNQNAALRRPCGCSRE